MSNKYFEKFKKTGSIEDYLKYIKSKKLVPDTVSNTIKL